MTQPKDRSVILSTAEALINGSRNDAYGDAFDNFTNIATGWSVLLGVPVKPHQVAQCMAWVKQCRLEHTPQHFDSWVDMAGYAALGGEIAEREMDV